MLLCLLPTLRSYFQLEQDKELGSSHLRKEIILKIEEKGRNLPALTCWSFWL
jgi:hypothetical protein